MLRSDETKIKLFDINSTKRVWRKKNAEYDPKNNIHTVKIGGEYIFFMPRVQDDFIVLRDQWMEPCTVKFRTRTSFLQPEYQRSVRDVQQHDNNPKIPPRQQKCGDEAH